MLEQEVRTMLAATIGEDEAHRVMDDAKRRLGLDAIAEPEHVEQLGRLLRTDGGYVGIVGELLILKARRPSTP